MPLPALSDHLCFSLYAVHREITRVYQPLLQRLGLTYPQYLVMVSLWQADGVTVGAIGKQVGLETNTLTPLLKRLETAGHVVRRKDRRDERRVVIHLSDQGRALAATAQEIPVRFQKATGMSRAEAKAMQGWIDELRGTLVTAQTTAEA